MSAYPNPRAVADILADVLAGNNIPEPQQSVDVLTLLAALTSGGNRLHVEPLSALGVSRTLAVGATSAEITLTSTCRRVSLTPLVDMCIVIGTGAQTATSTSHYLLANTVKDFAVPAGARIAAIRVSTDGNLRISELL